MLTNLQINPLYNLKDKNDKLIGAQHLIQSHPVTAGT
jgi:hypothetical protein